jgi:hypothetical protein
MKLGTFVFPAAANPVDDGRIIRAAIGPIPTEQSRNSLCQFMRDVAPELRPIQGCSRRMLVVVSRSPKLWPVLPVSCRLPTAPDFRVA